MGRHASRATRIALRVPGTKGGCAAGRKASDGAETDHTRCDRGRGSRRFLCFDVRSAWSHGRGNYPNRALTHNALCRRLRRRKHHAKRSTAALGMGSAAQRSAFSKDSRGARAEDGLQVIITQSWRWLLIQAASIVFPTFEAPPLVMKEPKHAKPDSSGYFKNLDLISNAPERALLQGRGDAV